VDASRLRTGELIAGGGSQPPAGEPGATSNDVGVHVQDPIDGWITVRRLHDEAALDHQGHREGIVGKEVELGEIGRERRQAFVRQPQEVGSARCRNSI
jgi:hypothetical protein